MQANKARNPPPKKGVLIWAITNLIKAVFIETEFAWKFLKHERNYMGEIR